MFKGNALKDCKEKQFRRRKSTLIFLFMISAQVTVFVMAFPDPFHTTLFTEGFYR